MPDLLVMTLILAGGVAGSWALRRAWRAKAADKPRWRALGWTTIIVTLLWPAWVMGSVRGPFIGVTLLSVAAMVVVAAGVQVRAARAGRTGNGSLAPEPVERPTTRWRTTLRWLLAGPIGMITAMAVGICYAVWVPGEPQTRLIIGALIVPAVWGGAMAWTLADARILRATAVLVGTALAGFGISILKGFT
ncbi:hypothetical protein [Novosphingobium sp. AP12]|uniref:hypothetical protein n=1 Tax=Novosphingobium sp. AP12 TaxID=1144305 RepID=UPI000271E6F4|nr:hypothetical protein [Novosphingobium sp. AP12]EJL34475.1 hypothetical protein PMI02_00621 [Novosphingobium sp. AP12]